MRDFKIQGKCDGCRKVRWFIRKRKVLLPIGQTAVSKGLFCNSCARPLKSIK